MGLSPPRFPPGPAFSEPREIMIDFIQHYSPITQALIATLLTWGVTAAMKDKEPGCALSVNLQFKVSL